MLTQEGGAKLRVEEGRQVTSEHLGREAVTLMPTVMDGIRALMSPEQVVDDFSTTVSKKKLEDDGGFSIRQAASRRLQLSFEDFDGSIKQLYNSRSAVKVPFEDELKKTKWNGHVSFVIPIYAANDDIPGTSVVLVASMKSALRHDVELFYLKFSFIIESIINTYC